MLHGAVKKTPGAKSEGRAEKAGPRASNLRAKGDIWKGTIAIGNLKGRNGGKKKDTKEKGRLKARSVQGGGEKNLRHAMIIDGGKRKTLQMGPLLQFGGSRERAT